MAIKTSFLVFFALCSVLCNCTSVTECENQSSKMVGGVTISNCEEPPCILKKGSSVTIEQEFTAQNDVEKVITNVKAELPVLGWRFFPGVNGKSACDRIREKISKAAGCPLKAGVEYTYENTFEVLGYYPNIGEFPIRWSLQAAEDVNDENKYITCFKVTARIK